MIDRHTLVFAAALGACLTSAGTAQSAGLLRPEQLPRGDYETYWRQVGGNWLSGLMPTTIQGCDYPAAQACSAVAAGPHLAGATVRFNPAGCGAPAITIQCVVQKAGMGLPGGGRAGGATAPVQGQNTTGFTSGRYIMKTSSFTGIFTLSVTGSTFTGSVDWNLPGQRADPVIDGKLGNGSISFTRFCQGRSTCVQKYVGSASGGQAKGTWTGTGGRGAIAWTMRPY